MKSCPNCGGKGFPELEWEGELRQPGEGQLVCSNCGTIFAEGDEVSPAEIRFEDQLSATEEEPVQEEYPVE